MAVEYYLSKQLSITDIKNAKLGLSYKIYRGEEVAIISDKYGNYVQAWGVKNAKDHISFFNGKDGYGSEFIMHDIALAFNAMFITGDSYLQLSDELESMGINQMKFGDKYSLKYITMDMKESHLCLKIKDSKYRVTSSFTDEAYDVVRKMYANKREARIKAEIARDNEILFGQIAKMDKTNLLKSMLVALADNQIQECKTPKAF